TPLLLRGERRRGRHSERHGDRGYERGGDFHGLRCPGGGGVGRRAAATPETGVGVCHDMSSTTGSGSGRVAVRITRVPPREASVAPKPTVAATHVITAAMNRRMPPSTPAHRNAQPSTQSTRKIESPMSRN